MPAATESPSETEFLDVLAWLRCPTGAQGGYRPPHPVGQERAARRILSAYPRSLAPLKEVSDAPAEAAQWLLSTRFGASQRPAAPPQALQDKGYWTGLTGYLRLGPARLLRFELPYLHLVEDLFEIVVLDAHPLPPCEERHADLNVYMTFLAECFRELTGEHAVLRLIAPGYEVETIPQLPEQRLLSAVRMMHVLGPMAFLRPGAHCNQVIEEKGEDAASVRWRCPLREARICQPFGKWPNRTGSRS